MRKNDGEITSQNRQTDDERPSPFFRAPDFRKKTQLVQHYAFLLRCILLKNQENQEKNENKPSSLRPEANSLSETAFPYQDKEASSLRPEVLPPAPILHLQQIHKKRPVRFEQSFPLVRR